MIVGVIYRNYKSYKNITYIPISNGDAFCGLIGRNGVGKSTVLESLDVFFNRKPFNRNINNPNKNEESYIVPIFCIDKSKFSEEIISSDKLGFNIEAFSNAVWDSALYEQTVPTINYNYIELFKSFHEHIPNLCSYGISRDTHYLLPIGMNAERKVSLGIFRDKVFLDTISPQTSEEVTETRINDACNILTPILAILESYFQYVFIPKDVEPEKIVQFETKEIQTLLGEKLENIVSKLITKENISSISAELKKFIDDLSNEISGYKYKSPSAYQPNLKPDKIYSLIIEDFFSIRELHKETKDGKDISLKQLSSGEKQQAILTLVYSIIKNYRMDGDTSKLIVAVDEPESSLHVSACYDQFERLNDLSNYCCQILVTSHWYGFIPAMLTGSVTNICANYQGGNFHKAYIFNIRKYREEIKHTDLQHKIEMHKPLPIDVMLKSSNDFTQSVLMSLIGESKGFNWLICEGSSDKIYLDAYLQDLIKTRKLRIIPVCAASEVAKIYNRLRLLFDEVKESLNGKVFLLIDTDSQSISIESDDKMDNFLRARRIVNDEQTKAAKLVHTKQNTNPKTPNTDIEDALEGKLFYDTLCSFKDQYDLDFIDTISINETKSGLSSYYAMDLRPSEREKLDRFFNDHKGKNKVLFATQYVKLLTHNHNEEPKWINEIRQYFG